MFAHHLFVTAKLCLPKFGIYEQDDVAVTKGPKNFTSETDKYKSKYINHILFVYTISTYTIDYQP